MMNERWYLDRFLEIARRKYPESYFLDEVSFTFAANDDYDGPRRYLGDVVEIDGAGRLHLWLFAPLHGAALASGDLIGRLFAFTRVFAMAGPETVQARLERAAGRRYDTRAPRFRSAMCRPRREFDSWNLVACGGKGCEMAEREDNLFWQLYSSLSSDVGAARDVNTWHFYQTFTGFDLRSLWDLAPVGRLSLAEKMAIYDGAHPCSAEPDDDFDIASKRDLHLKRRKGFHRQGFEAYFGDRAQILAR